MPPRFLVQGGRPLRGTVRPAGNKNAALPILAATLLADGPVDLDNIPRIRTSVLTQNQRALEGLNFGADDFDLPIEDEVTQKAGATISLDFERILNYARELGFEPEYRHVSLGQPRWTDVS